MSFIARKCCSILFHLSRAKQCCNESVALLEEVLASFSKKKSSGNQSQIVLVKDHLARAYLWRHLVKDVKIEQVSVIMECLNRTGFLQGLKKS